MRATVAAVELLAAVRITATAVSARPPVPVLAGVKITAGKDGLTLSTFDFDSAATATIRGQVSDPGAVLVSHRLLAQIVSSVKGGDITIEGTAPVVITAGRATWRLPVMPLSEYPDLPSVEDVIATVDGQELATMVERVAQAATETVETSPPLDVVYVGIADDRLELAALDRYRLHTATVGADCTDSGFLLVPAKRLAAMVKHLSASPVTLTRSAGLLALSTPTATLSTRLSESERGWNDWQGLLRASDTVKASAEIDRDELLHALRQVGSFAEEAGKGSRHLTLQFDTRGDLTINAGTDADGSGSAVVSTNHDGPGILVTVNVQFLAEGIGTCDHRTVRLGFSGPKRPIAVYDGESPLAVVVMPVGGAVSARWLDDEAAVA